MFSPASLQDIVKTNGNHFQGLPEEMWGIMSSIKRALKKGHPNALASCALGYHTGNLGLGQNSVLLAPKASDGLQPLEKGATLCLGRLACGSWQSEEHAASEARLSGW